MTLINLIWEWMAKETDREFNRVKSCRLRVVAPWGTELRPVPHGATTRQLPPQNTL